MKEVSSGRVVVLNGRVLALKKYRGDWVLPKGRLEGDESLEEAALREVYEETGIKTEIVRYTVEKVPTLIALSAGAILGGIMGSLNGLLITKLKLQPFIATLGTMSVYRGLAYVFTGGWPVLGIPDTYRKTFTTKLF